MSLYFKNMKKWYYITKILRIGKPVNFIDTALLILKHSWHYTDITSLILIPSIHDYILDRYGQEKWQSQNNKKQYNILHSYIQEKWNHKTTCLSPNHQSTLYRYYSLNSKHSGHYMDITPLILSIHDII
jgi:hypothetical protein